MTGDDDRLPASLDIGKLVPGLSGGGWRGRLREGLHRWLGILGTYRLFRRADVVELEGGRNVFLNALDELGVRLDCGDLRERIPAQGPVVVVANHPFGGSDAAALSGLCGDVRADSKVFANAMSAALPGTERWTIPLYIMGEEGATSMNLGAMKEGLAQLRAGGVLVVFPAGAVSRWRNDLGRVADPEWSLHIARLAMKTGASVLPVRFFGMNPVWFESLGVLHPMMRSLLILRAFLWDRGKTVRCRAGRMIAADELLAAGSVEEATALMRAAVEGIEEP